MFKSPYPIPHIPYPRHQLMMLFFAAVVLGFGIVAFAPIPARAATNISANVSQHWAWNDFIGWIDFRATNNIMVSSANLTGYASSSVGYISLDCHTSPAGNICGTSNYQVLNDGNGNLSGWG